MMRSAPRLLVCALLLCSCALPGNAAPVVKIGLIAPFEGLGRPLGYALLPAVRIALDEANASAALGRYRVALVALNDNLDGTTAAAQARALAQDPDVLAALGPWSEGTTAGSRPVLAAAGIPSVAGAPPDTPTTAPAASQRPAALSLCPPVSQIAAVLAREAATGGTGRALVVGPDNALSDALLAEGTKAPTRLQQSSVISDTGFVPGPDVETVFYTGDAAGAADDLWRWRAAGWTGRLLGGPELAQPWFIGRAGASAEGARAVVCAPSAPAPASFAAAYRAQAGSDPGPEAILAYEGARAVLAALAKDIAVHGRPTRAGVAATLAGQPVAPAVGWQQVVGGKWTVR